MPSIAAVSMVDCAYDLDSSERGWLERCAKQVAAAIPGASAPFGYRVSRTDDGLVFHEAYLDGFPDAKERLTAMHSAMTPALLDAFFKPGTSSGTMKTVLDEVAHPPAVVEEFHALLALKGGADVIPFGGVDAYGRGVIVGASIDRLYPSKAMRTAQERVGVHFSAAMRLRQRLIERELFEVGEAMLEADGRLAHAEGGAVPRRETLAEAVKKIERVKTRAGREDDESLSMWRGLVEGRWSLVDHVDTDGRRYYVAVSNPAAGVAARALDEVEAQIVAMAVAGEPNKVIAYALGLATSTVGVRLGEAMRKLGVPTRTDLIRVGKRLLEP